MTTTKKLENKKTSDLLESIYNESKDGDWSDECTEILDELKSREPFLTLFMASSGESLSDEIDSLKEEIKLLKRHKHDQKSGDVMVRI